ncbi:BCCT family transporter [Helicobacter sp.]|uniref:BCCT family transporter n=1 Tax=Helicobacter sp. TaxID=218 RepID=UPI00199949A8|nr:BCCT family transporter [Helicobacter sp.]MBD5164678.1 BCCT family transporter [Helicobacter sp.]
MNLKSKSIDWVTMLIPFVIVIALMGIFMIAPEQSTHTVDSLRDFFGNKIGLYYPILAVGSVVCALYVAINNKYGNLRLGNIDKPLYSNFKWGTMIFTSTMAADIMFYSLIEWALYGGEQHVQDLGGTEMWAETFTLFHWGPLAWGFYVILAVCFAFMMHVRKRERQRFSEACRPLLGKYVDGVCGKIIDIVAIFAIVCATATTFSLATPLLTEGLGRIFNFEVSTAVTILVLMFICLIYTVTVLFGVKGISRLAQICSYLFFAVLAYFMFLGGETQYILENGFQSLGNMVQNFVGLSTYMDPLRANGFAQNWTVYYWAYWLVWCVATPFFIALISKGRTLRNVVYGTFGWGLAGTYMSFIILGGYGLSQQLKHGVDVIGFISAGGEMYDGILMIFDTLPLPSLALLLLVITMIAFYSTTLDGITYVTSAYSYKQISPDEEPSKKIRGFWSIMLILLPIGLLFAENTLYSLQGVTIIAAFPIGILLIMIVWSFFKDYNNFLKKKGDSL